MNPMTRTERLYYTDCYLREFEARVFRSEPAPNGFKVYLDRTAFYPTSGGQPTDSGTIAGMQVLEAVDEGDEIAHILRQAPEAESVSGKIDWARRFDHMQQHTGQHILSAAFERIGDYKTVSFHLGEDSSSIDLDSDRLGVRQLQEAEDAANQVVFENRAVRILFSRRGRQADWNCASRRLARARFGWWRLRDLIYPLAEELTSTVRVPSA